jgi:hypothetical protein
MSKLKWQTRIGDKDYGALIDIDDSINDDLLESACKAVGQQIFNTYAHLRCQEFGHIPRWPAQLLRGKAANTCARCHSTIRKSDRIAEVAA